MVYNQTNYGFRILNKRIKAEEKMVKIIYKDGEEIVTPMRLLRGIINVQRNLIFTYLPL